MIILPAIDIRGGRCVRLFRGDYARETVYGDDPVAMAQHWVTLGARFLHVVDLDGARAGQPVHADIIARIAQTAGVPIEVGGGLRKREAIAAFLASGVERVIVGTRALEDPDWLAEMCAAFPGRIVCAVDARRGKIAVHGWEAETTSELLDFIASRLNGIGLRAILFTDITSDGTLAGPDIEAIRAVCAASEAPVIAAGGIGAIEHVRAVAALPVEGLVIGRALYAGTVDLRQALLVADEKKSPGTSSR